MILTQKRITWSMYKAQVTSPYSLLRTLEYETIKGLELNGQILDVGGGANTSYFKLLNIKGSITSVNIDPGVQPSIVLNLNDGLPFDDNAFDTIICFNTLEHLKKDEFVISEMCRVLKEGGKIHILVPFLYKVHGSPSDFHRHTAYWWEEKFQAHGFNSQKIIIDPLGWDQLGSGLSISEYWSLPKDIFREITRKSRKAFILFFGLLAHTIRWRKLSRIPSAYAYHSDFAVGYYIEAQK